MIAFEYLRLVKRKREWSYDPPGLLDGSFIQTVGMLL